MASTLLQAAARRPAPPLTRYAAGFWLITGCYAAAVMAGTIPTPLYVLYQRRDHFGTGALTIAFAVYALGVVLSLLLAGHTSDHLGRRPLISTAILVQLLACVVFLATPGLPFLLAGRLLSGLSVGLLTSAATAHLFELHSTSRPGASARRAELVSTAANLGGIALGPLLAGVLAQWAPDPLRVPYLATAALLILSALVLNAVPETRAATAGWSYRPQIPRLPAGVTGSYLAACAAGLVSFAIFGLFGALTPSFLAVTLHRPSHALAGLVAFLGLGAGALAQLITPSARRLATTAACAAIIAGLACTVAGAWLPSLSLFIIGGILAGGGAGTVFKASLAAITALGAHDARAGVLAGLFTASYAGLALPVLGLGIAAQHTDPRTALIGFAAAVSAALLLAAPALLRATTDPAGHRPHTQGPPSTGDVAQ